MSLADIVGDGTLSPAQIDEHGTTFGFLQDFATGTNPDGTLKSDYSCSDWADGTSASSWSGGTTDATDTGFASGASSSCGPPLHLLCLELGSGDAVPYPHLAGALAFVTNATGSGDFATWSGSGGVGGIAGGNAVCRHLARIDGIPVADSVADLTDHTLRSSLGIDETGARSDLLPWTGTLAGGTASGDDCAGWTDGTVGAQGESGRASRASGTWSEASTAACNGAHPIYCFGTVVLLGWDNFERGDFSRWSAVVE